MSSGGDWRRPDWLDAMRAWTPGALMPPSLRQAMRPVADLFGFAPYLLGKELIDQAASRLVDRPLTIRTGDTDISLVLRVLQFEQPPIGLMIGQLGNVVLEAEDVTIAGFHISHLRLDVRNLHVQTRVPTPAVVAAPIKVRAVIDQRVIAEVVATRTDRVWIDLRADGVARASLAGRRGWGHVDLVPRMDGRTLVLDPSNVAVRRRESASVARRLPPLRVALSSSFPEAHVTDVAIESGCVVVSGVYEEWRRPMAPMQFEDLLGQIKQFDGGALRIPTANVGS
jgi:hypothetical protein